MQQAVDTVAVNGVREVLSSRRKRGGNLSKS
jgi:hypothetical protein